MAARCLKVYSKIRDFTEACLADYRSAFWTSGILVVAILLAAGCGDGRDTRLPVGGIVTVDGEPLKFGDISFLPIEGGDKATRPGGGRLGEDGSYQVTSYTLNDGLLKGKYKVRVLAIEPIGETSQRWHAPEKYSKAETSGLTVEILEETKELNFDLSWKGEKRNKPYVEKFN